MDLLAKAKAARRRFESSQAVPPLASPEAEARRQRLLARLNEAPELHFALETAWQPDGSVQIAFATRGATCELTVPGPRDPIDFARDLIAMLERQAKRQ